MSIFRNLGFYYKGLAITIPRYLIEQRSATYVVCTARARLTKLAPKSKCRWLWGRCARALGAFELLQNLFLIFQKWNKAKEVEIFFGSSMRSRPPQMNSSYSNNDKKIPFVPLNGDSISFSCSLSHARTFSQHRYTHARTLSVFVNSTHLASVSPTKHRI